MVGLRSFMASQLSCTYCMQVHYSCVHVLFSVPLCAHISTADFMVAPLALTFDSDTRSQDVVVTALHDTVSEGDEDFSLSLTGDTAVLFSVSTATVTITDASELVEYSLL